LLFSGNSQIRTWPKCANGADERCARGRTERVREGLFDPRWCHAHTTELLVSRHTSQAQHLVSVTWRQLLIITELVGCMEHASGIRGCRQDPSHPMIVWICYFRHKCALAYTIVGRKSANKATMNSVMHDWLGQHAAAPPAALPVDLDARDLRRGSSSCAGGVRHDCGRQLLLQSLCPPSG
jgi:hypothetical protein